MTAKAAPLDAEAIAAAALADAPPPKATAPVAAPTTIDFKCPQCDEAVKMGIEMAGKQAPCPLCKRIIKVPQLVKVEPKDWRKTDTKLPSGARRDTDTAPEGAWGSATTVSNVSRGALLEANAIPEKKEPRTLRQKMFWPSVAVVVVAVGIGGFLWIGGLLAHNKEEKALALALEYVDGQGKKPQLDPLAACEVLRGAGEYHARNNDNQYAREYMQAARGQLSAAEASHEREARALDLAVAQTALILSPAQIEKAKIRREAEREQERGFKEVERTLLLIHAPEARAEAIRQITRKLIAKDLGTQAPRLVAEVSGGNRLDEAAIVALELWRADKNREADELADQLLKSITPPVNPKGPAGPKTAIAAPALVALCLVLKKPGDTVEALKIKLGNDKATQLGQIEGLARRNEADKARALADPSIDAQAVLAAVGLEKTPPETADAETVLKWAEDKKNFEEEPANKPYCWSLWRLTRLAARANKPELATQLANSIPDPQLRARAKLEALRARLDHASGKAGDDWANQIDAQAPAHAVGQEEVARHNARHGQGGALMKAIGGWQPEALRPFGYLGVALGIQDGAQ